MSTTTRNNNSTIRNIVQSGLFDMEIHSFATRTLITDQVDDIVIKVASLTNARTVYHFYVADDPFDTFVTFDFDEAVSALAYAIDIVF